MIFSMKKSVEIEKHVILQKKVVDFVGLYYKICKLTIHYRTTVTTKKRL